VLTVLPRVPVLAHAPRLRKLDHAIPVEAAIVLAVEDGAIFADIRRGALAGAKPIADSFRCPRKYHDLDVFKLTRDLSAVGAIVTTVRAVLRAIVVVLAHGAGTCDVRAVDAIISRVAFAEAMCAYPIPRTVASAIMCIEHPEVTKDTS
jgi:hypothetical protein